MKHSETWLWLWFMVGLLLHIVLHAYNIVNGPDQSINSYGDLLRKRWPPLLIRVFIDSMVFWALFTPGFTDRAIGYLGWKSGAWVVDNVIQYAPFSGMFGYVVDSVVNFVVSKIPGIQNLIPPELPVVSTVQEQHAVQIPTGAPAATQTMAPIAPTAPAKKNGK